MMKIEFRYLKIKIRCRQGFTMIETMIAVALVVILGLSCAGMVSFFARYTKQDTLKTCLVQAASSGIEAVRANPNTTSLSVSCGDYTANVNIATSGTLPAMAPAMGSNTSACITVTSTSTIEGKTMVLRDLICKLPEG